MAVVLGLLVGAVIGGLGGGGGVLTVPALVYVLGQPARDATTASVVIVGITAATGVLARARDVDWRTGFAFGAVGIPATWLGTALNHRVGQTALMLAFAGLTLAVAAAMLTNDRGGTTRTRHGKRARRGADERSSETVSAGRTTELVALPVRRSGWGLLTTAAQVVVGGGAVGFLTGFLGVGGGFLVMPVLVVGLRLPTVPAIGTSLLVIAVNSASALVSRIGALDLDWRVVAPFTVAAVVGALGGKRVADRLSGRTLEIAFAVLLAAVGLSVGIQSLLAASG